MAFTYRVTHTTTASSPGGAARLLGAMVVLCVCAHSLKAQSSAAETGSLTGPPENSLREFRLVESSLQRIVFEYTPHFSPARKITVAGEEYLGFEFDESYSVPDYSTEGAPNLQQRNVPLIFPSSGSPIVRILESDYEDVSNVLYLPVPRRRVKDGLVDVEGYTPDRQFYSTNRFLPDRVVETADPQPTRSLLVGFAVIRPIQYNPVLRTVRRFSRLKVEVLFGRGPVHAVEGSDKVMFQNSVLNAHILSSLPTGAIATKKAALAPSVLAAGDWFRIPVTEEGMYKLDATYLQTLGINLAALNPRTIKIYGNGGKEVPENIRALRATDLIENAIYVEGESDGNFGAGDYVLFYGKSPRGWTYDATGRRLRHYIHHYTEVNYYWLTFGGVEGKRMTNQPSLTSPATTVAEKFVDGLFLEEEKVNKLGSGKDWLGHSFDKANPSFTFVNSLPGLVANGQITYRYRLVARDSYVSQFTVSEGNTILGVHSFSPVYLYAFARGETYEVVGSSSLAGNTSQLRFTLGSTGEAEGWLDWFEIQYPRMLWGVNNYLRFRSPDTTGIVEYRLQQFTALPMIFNVTQPENVRIIQGVSGSYTFLDSTRSGSPRDYCAAGSASWKTPAAAQKVSNQDLRGFAAGADFIILTSQEFRSAADRLKTFREKAAAGGLKTLVVDVQQVYNEFGGGLPDITALRDYLKYAYDNWTPRPSFVLMLGGASYDYKGILGKQSSFVPTWQSNESLDDVNSYASDDFFVQFGDGTGVYLIGGRISSRTAAEANTVVDKIIGYEESPARDDWKLRMLFIGDDSWTSEGEEGTIHSTDAEIVSSPTFTPDEFEKEKIYIAEYPTVFTAVGRRKPGAAQEIIDQINRGALVVNYSGHGNNKVWAHEMIFEVSTTIPQLLNADKLTLFFLATCNFSQYDKPEEYTGSELLMNKADGGAVGVISATRKVYQGNNAALNQGTFQRMFTRDLFNRVQVERPATALFLYKATSYNGENDQKFFYMGDPTTRLQYPRMFGQIDSVNGVSLAPANGQLRPATVQLKALSRVTVSGTIRTAGNGIDSTFSGTMSLSVNDVSRTQTIVNFYPGTDWSYQATGGTIFRGENSVANGRFRGSFIVPKDISYADTTGRGRLLAYFYSGGNDGVGFSNSITIGGTDSSAKADQVGPEMAVYLDSRSFRPGDMTSERPTLIVDLRDSSGVNTSTTGIGHRIEAWVNNSTQSKDLTPYYSSKLDDYREGSVNYALSGLSPGKNHIRVRAWDSYNNSSVAETFFEVASSANLTIRDVFNYPNPFSQATDFTFRHNQSSPLDVEVKVFTLAGRLVQSLETTSVGEPMVRLPWDGRDRDGDILANGVYLYKIIVRTVDGRFTSEALGKLSIIR